MKNIKIISIYIVIVLMLMAGIEVTKLFLIKLNGVNNNITLLREQQNLLDENQKQFKLIDVDNIENIIKANIIVYNDTLQVRGSGTHIKINDKSYILTAGHLIDKETDIIKAGLDNGTIYLLDLVKVNKENDLALFKINEINNFSYLKISEQIPKAGSEIIVIGNPDSLRDTITEGIIAKERPKGYIITNIIYFGNSGGALLYKGQIAGVMSSLVIYSQPENSVFVNYGYAIKLKIIKEFLEDIQ